MFSSFPRLMAIMAIAILSGVLVVIVAVSANREASLAQRIADYRTFPTFTNTHASGKEISMQPMETLQACQKACLRTEGCSVVVYNMRGSRPGKPPQCWLLSGLVHENLDVTNDCCVLSILATQKADLNHIQRRIAEQKGARATLKGNPVP